MTERKLTDEEVIEFLRKQNWISGVFPKEDEYITITNNDVADLINRQKAEIESLKGLIIRNDEKYLSYAATMIKEERELRQIERTRRLEAEIERLETEKVKLHKLIPKMIKEAKAEAIKEFAEEFEKRCLERGIYPVLIKNILKNLVKEKTEDKQ